MYKLGNPELRLLVLFSFFYHSINAQNLVPNPDFHEVQQCPLFLADFTMAEWIDPIFPDGSSDCFNICSNTFATSVPTNGFGFQESDTGEGYVGLSVVSNQDEYREYIQVELLEPLEEGVCYEIRMTYSQSDVSGSSNNLGLVITNDPPNDFFAVEPQLEIIEVITETENWLEEIVQFSANGGEKILSIGNFRNDASTTFVPNPPVPYAYYLIDFVSVEKIEIEFSDDLVELGEDIAVCETDFPINLTSGVSEGVYSWSTGETTASINVAGPGTYFLTVTEECEFGIDSIELFLDDFSVEFDLGADTTICSGTSLDLSFPELMIYDLEWQDGSNLPTQTVTEAKIYWLNVVTACGVQSRDSIQVDFHPAIEPFELGPIEGLCEGDTILLDGYQDNAISYQWQDGSTESLYEVSEAGLYSLAVEGICEIFSSDIIIENLDQVEITADIDSSYWICDGEVLNLEIESNGAEEILWSDGSIEFWRSFDDGGSYSFQLFNFCKDSIFNFELEEENCFEKDVYIPNVFTPNSDGHNDIFSVFLPEEWVDPELEVSIYNRWGERIYYSEEVDFGWDGKFKGQALNPGVYVYIVVLDVEIGNRFEQLFFQGDVAIMN